MHNSYSTLVLLQEANNHYIYIYIYIYICHRHENRVMKEMKRFGAFVVFGVLAWMPVDAQMNHGSSNVHAQWYSHWKIRADNHDVMRISHAIKGGNYKRRALPNLRAVVWVFWY